ncbi:uncharacterized protein EV420DRAFT_1270546 [Desarmillaria tabescens]|uniref:EXPERA domain-containing protein n=1 Tax=Armillaria tabescens TaxID=1929756 RepID=A0AA39N5M2_ARMTA|nr:uncharacterized protein EV420DRAFT_1270546 [Desarmillaria tabescens]KAK0458299.1 hypothetical protein EV420DRAFT_1270546 [Desarmillaria tabescens]
MTAQTYWWITAWFAITIPIIFWDAGYLFLRPRSMEGGDLHWIWQPYSIYQNVRRAHIYGAPALVEKDGFPNAQSLLNIVENFLNIAYLYLAYVARWPPAGLIAFTSACLTLAKTLLYWVQEYYCGMCNIGHNSTHDLTLYWIIPNGVWLVVPTLIILRLGKDLISSLNLAHGIKSKTKSS